MSKLKDEIEKLYKEFTEDNADTELIDSFMENLRVIINENEEKIYCIEVYRESEDVCILHHKWSNPPSWKEVLEYINTQDLNYNDEYGKFECYQVN